jgi:hypothetical protein
MWAVSIILQPIHRTAYNVQNAIDAPYHAIDGPRNNRGAEGNIARLLAAWRQDNRPVIHIRHDSTFPTSAYRPGQDGNKFKTEVTPAAGETVISTYEHHGLSEKCGDLGGREGPRSGQQETVAVPNCLPQNRRSTPTAVPEQVYSMGDVNAFTNARCSALATTHERYGLTEFCGRKQRTLRYSQSSRTRVDSFATIFADSWSPKR